MRLIVVSLALGFGTAVLAKALGFTIGSWEWRTVGLPIIVLGNIAFLPRR